MDPHRTQEILNRCIKNYNSYGIKPRYEEIQLSNVTKIVQKEKKRLGVQHPKITLEDIGLQQITSKDNLYTLAKNNQVKITKICSNSHNKVILTLQASHPIDFTLESGTLLFPEDSIANNTQSLIIRDDVSTRASECQSQLQVSTFCFNQELKSPAHQTFYLGSIKSSRYQKGMNQTQVWQITNEQRSLLRELEEKYQIEDQINTAQTSKINPQK